MHPAARTCAAVVQLLPTSQRLSVVGCFLRHVSATAPHHRLVTRSSTSRSLTGHRTWSTHEAHYKRHNTVEQQPLGSPAVHHHPSDMGLNAAVLSMSPESPVSASIVSVSFAGVAAAIMGRLQRVRGSYALCSDGQVGPELATAGSPHMSGAGMNMGWCSFWECRLCTGDPQQVILSLPVGRATDVIAFWCQCWAAAVGAGFRDLPCCNSVQCCAGDQSF